jgi:iron(III) transport system permease protein
VAWPILLLFAVLALPWFEGGAFGASAVAEGLAGRVWLLPLVVLAVALAWLAIAVHDWRSKALSAALVGAALVWLFVQGFGIGLRGPALPGIELLFPQAAAGQPGFGWGAWIAGIALLGALAEVVAARGFCRGRAVPGLCRRGHCHGSHALRLLSNPQADVGGLRRAGRHTIGAAVCGPYHRG